MTHIIYGAVGVIAVLLLLISGAVIGWKARVSYEAHNRKVVEHHRTEEEKALLEAQQKEFDAMMSYSSDIAYGAPTHHEMKGR